MAALFVFKDGMLQFCWVFTEELKICCSDVNEYVCIALLPFYTKQ